MGLASFWSSRLRAPRTLPQWSPTATAIPVNGDDMGVLVYIVLTVLIFGLLGLVQKLVEGL